MSAPRAACVALYGLTLLPAAVVAAPPGNGVSRLPAPQAAYLTSCGGCHGIRGISAPRVIPTLRHLTGTFLCTRQGRQFIVRLPDVALSSLSDQMLTTVMNWVVFDLGAPVAGGRAARPYTVAEVARLRRQPLTDTGLGQYRRQVVAQLASRCTVPAALRVYDSGMHQNRTASSSSDDSKEPGHASRRR